MSILKTAINKSAVMTILNCFCVAFLVAQITDWAPYNLLNGEANLFFKDTYLGRSYLDVQAVSDTLDLSLGRDYDIVVKRVNQRQFARQKFLSKKTIDLRAWEINIRNNKASIINISVEDQIPLSVRDEIEVDKEIVGGMYNENTGKIRWNLQLTPNQSKSLKFKYSVKYPKNNHIVLE